jgi:hypothetical protein
VLFFCVLTILQPVMKEMIEKGSHFIRFHDKADSLRSKFLLYTLPNASLLFFLYRDPSFYPEALRLAEKRSNDLEKKLKASEKACEKAEQEAASVGDLRERLHAAENALSEKEEKIAKWEADIIARFKT